MQSESPVILCKTAFLIDLRSALRYNREKDMAEGILMETFEKRWEKAGLSDDYVFCKVMLKPELCKRMLELILNVKISRIEYVEEQKTIDIKKDSRGIRLDIYVCDDEETVYNVEIQTRNTRELSKRSRYYQALIDLHILRKGVHYKSLNQSFVIFICTFDVFGAGRHLYTFENICKEEPAILLGDGTTKIFLNTQGTQDDVSPELKAFLNFVAGEKSEDPFVQQLDEEIRHIKSNEEWRREYMTIQELNQEMRDEGIEIGRKEGLEKGRKEGRTEERTAMIRNVLYTLKNAEQTAKMLRIDAADVWSVVKAERIPVDDYPN